jgi:hypothetical protein
MLAFLFVAVLIIPTIWLWLHIKWYREDTQVKGTNKTENIKFVANPLATFRSRLP